MTMVVVGVVIVPDERNAVATTNAQTIWIPDVIGGRADIIPGAVHVHADVAGRAGRNSAFNAGEVAVGQHRVGAASDQSVAERRRFGALRLRRPGRYVKTVGLNI